MVGYGLKATGLDRVGVNEENDRVFITYRRIRVVKFMPVEKIEKRNVRDRSWGIEYLESYCSRMYQRSHRLKQFWTKTALYTFV